MILYQYINESVLTKGLGDLVHSSNGQICVSCNYSEMYMLKPASRGNNMPHLPLHMEDSMTFMDEAGNSRRTKKVLIIIMLVCHVPCDL